MIDITRLLPFAVILAVAGPLKAHADFRMDTPSIQPATEIPAEATIVLAPKFRNAKGYGNDVPLEFAARQIVPTAIRLRFGPGIDRDALVTWRGDAPWNHVLIDAVRPLGLHVLTGTTEVTISRLR